MSKIFKNTIKCKSCGEKITIELLLPDNCYVSKVEEGVFNPMER